MIKAVVFDCFGVLVGEGWKAFVNKHFGSSGERHEWANEQMQQVSRGILTHQQMADLMCETTSVSAEDFLAVLHTNPVNIELFDYIRSLKPRYKIGFLSNVGMNRLDELFTKEQLALFDGITLSYDIGIAKPDAGAYLHAAHQLELSAEECIMVDDTLSYCDGAETVGMKAIQFTNVPDLKMSIGALL